VEVPDASSDERQMPDEEQSRLDSLNTLFWYSFGLGWLWVPLGLIFLGHLAEQAGVSLRIVGSVMGILFLSWVAFTIVASVRLVYCVRCPQCRMRLVRGQRPREFSSRGRWLFWCAACGIHWDTGIRPQNFNQPNG
jgi:hypothetical protein